MRKLAKDLYAANREMKSVLRNSEYGVSYDFLRHNTRLIAALSTADFDALLKYTIDTDTVLCYTAESVGNENRYLILLIYVTPQIEEKIGGSRMITYDPRKEKSKVQKQPDATKLPVRPKLHLPHQKPTVIEDRKFDKEVRCLRDELKLAAVECLALVEKRRFGATQSELTKLVPSFDYLSPADQGELLKGIDTFSVNYRYIDGHKLPTRGTHAYVLVHNAFIGKEDVEYASQPLEVESPMAAQLSALKSKLVLAPEPTEVVTDTTRAVTPPETTKPEPVVTPVVTENVAQTAAPLAHEPKLDDILKPAPWADVNGGQHATDEGKGISLGDIQKQMGAILERIAMQQTQIAIAQMTINSASAAITEDTVLLSKLREALVANEHKTVL